jgi:molybdopterin converting factor small subunit
MDVEVRTYGDIREQIGQKTVRLSLEAGATVADLLDALEARTGYDPGTLPSGKRLVVRRDRTHLGKDAALTDGDSVGVSQTPVPEG